MSSRPHPFELIFGEIAVSRFPEIQSAIGSDISLETFLMSGPAITLLQDLRPEEGLGEGDDFVALVYAAFRFWAEGCHTIELDEKSTRSLGTAQAPTAASPTGTRYIQIAPRLIWASLDGTEHHEPLDGWFTIPSREGIRVVAAFGVHPGRPGLSVLTAAGRLAAVTPYRDDGSPLFAATMSSGDVAELLSIASLEELLLLGWHAVSLGEVIDG